MNVFATAFSGLGQAYDPPCDPGFFCEFDDESIAGQLMLWIIILGVLVAIFFLGILNDSVSKRLRKRRKTQKPLASTANQPTPRNSRQSVSVPPKKVGRTYFNYRCQTCNSWFFVEDEKIDSRKPPQLCNRCRLSPTS